MTIFTWVFLQAITNITFLPTSNLCNEYSNSLDFEFWMIQRILDYALLYEHKMIEDNFLW